MFSNKIKASDFYFGQPAQNLLLNESDTMMESSQSAPPSGSQKLELSQITNSQDLFVETPGLEPADHEIPSSSYDRYMHFKPFQPYTFPSKKCLQRIPSSAELPDAKIQINDEHLKKLDSIYDVIKEVIEVVKPLKNDINLIKADILDQKNILTEVKNSWDEKWSKANSAFKNAHDIMSDIKTLAETTADEVKTSNTRFGEFVKEEVSNVKLHLNNHLHDNKEGMNRNADKICMEICKLHDQALVKTSDIHHVLGAEIEKILWDHASSITKKIEDCVAGLQDATLSTLNSIKEIADKLNHNKNDIRPPSRSFCSNYNNDYKFRISNAHPSSCLPPHSMECHTPNAYQQLPPAYIPFNRNTAAASLNNTFHHGDSSDIKGGGTDSFFDDIRFISKRKQNIRELIFPKMPPSHYISREYIPPYCHKSKPMDMNTGITGQERVYQNGLRKDAQVVAFNSSKSNTMRNTVDIHNESNIQPIENKFKIDPKRVKVETEYFQSSFSPPIFGATSENMNTKSTCKATNVIPSSHSKCSSNRKINGYNSPSAPNSRKVYMLRSQQKSCGNKENNSTQYHGRAASMIKNVRSIENNDSCIVIDD